MKYTELFSKITLSFLDSYEKCLPLDGAVDFLEQVIFLFRYLDNFLQQRVP
jgi:hypothetical protein